jgi:hypothetical protein
VFCFPLRVLREIMNTNLVNFNQHIKLKSSLNVIQAWSREQPATSNLQQVFSGSRQGQWQLQGHNEETRNMKQDKSKKAEWRLKQGK